MCILNICSIYHGGAHFCMICWRADCLSLLMRSLCPAAAAAYLMPLHPPAAPPCRKAVARDAWPCVSPLGVCESEDQRRAVLVRVKAGGEPCLLKWLWEHSAACMLMPCCKVAAYRSTDALALAPTCRVLACEAFPFVVAACPRLGLLCSRSP